MQIAFLIVYIVILGLDMCANLKTLKYNRKVESEIDFLEKCIDKDIASNKNLLKQVENLIDVAERKSTAQDNVLWKSIMILAKEINKLEDKNRV